MVITLLHVIGAGLARGDRIDNPVELQEIAHATGLDRHGSVAGCIEKQNAGRFDAWMGDAALNGRKNPCFLLTG